MNRRLLQNPFMDAPLVPLETQIENVKYKLERMVSCAETGREWADVADVEARELAPLLTLRDRNAEAAIAAIEKDLAPELLALKAETAVAGALKGHLSRQQVEWAKGHDWFVADLGSGLIQVVDRWVNINTGDRGNDLIVWDKTFSELRDWAGY
jgi:hypothetical protein